VTRDPFLIGSPTCISFSGGRTSAYMLWRVLQSNGGLPSYAAVCFANTGKEDEATLRFVKRVSDEWDVPIYWLEYRNNERGFAVVDFYTASRNGEPFEAIIRKRNFLPNPVARFCTVALKIEPELKFLKSIGWDDWDNMVGIRADEPRRVAKIRANPSGGKAGPERVMPLAEAGVTKRDVFDFWTNSPFDLELPNMNGVTMHGNCDLCFLKGASQIQSLINEKPERAVWWARMESIPLNSKNGGLFRSDRPNYSEMLKYSGDQKALFAEDDEPVPCFCGE
jgi:3'-phosphoadenosine 5'-phosphosulfate sulfotransferase (PAPS reductase)/FAD synthetase